MAERLVIHRDHTFEFKDERYQATRLGPYGSGDDCWQVYRLPDFEDVDVFYRLEDIRRFVEHGLKEDWPTLVELPEPLRADWTGGAS